MFDIPMTQRMAKTFLRGGVATCPQPGWTHNRALKKYINQFLLPNFISREKYQEIFGFNFDSFCDLRYNKKPV
jgi:hypothetical protein